MSEAFEAIAVEIKRPIDSDWINVWVDVMHEPRPQGSIGIPDNGYLDRVSNSGRFKFSLDNSAKNSQLTLGYYSPGNAGELPVGTEVRLSFTYAGRKRYKWYGFVAPGGAVPTPGELGPRRVDVTCYDWFGLIAQYPLDFLARQTNKTIMDGVASIIASLPESIQPPNVVYGTPTYTFPSTFDLMKGETTAIGEFNKLAISEMGYIYSRGNETDGFTLHIDGKDARFAAPITAIPAHSSETTDLFLLANGTDKLRLANGVDRLLLTRTVTPQFNDDDLSINSGVKLDVGRHYANYIKAAVTPRRVDAAATTILYTMESSVEVGAGQTVSGLRGRYRDPAGGASYVNAVDDEMVTPVANTDFQAFANADGTGTDLTASCSVTATFGTAEVEFSITNTGGTTFYTGGDILFQFRGKGVYAYDVVNIVIDRTDEDTKVGRHILTFDMVYQSDPVEIKSMLQESVLNPEKISAEFVDITSYPLDANRNVKNMMAFMYLDIGSRNFYEESMSNYGITSFINGYDFEITAGKYVTWKPCLARRDTVPS